MVTAQEAHCSLITRETIIKPAAFMHWALPHGLYERCKLPQFLRILHKAWAKARGKTQIQQLTETWQQLRTLFQTRGHRHTRAHTRTHCSIVGCWVQPAVPLPCVCEWWWQRRRRWRQACNDDNTVWWRWLLQPHRFTNTTTMINEQIACMP